MNRMRHNVSELEGALLDAAVAKAENCSTVEYTDSGGRIDFEPSSNWQDGGPIIERERIGVQTFGLSPGLWFASFDYESHYYEGSTPLIAAMRAYVASKFGDEIELA